MGRHPNHYTDWLEAIGQRDGARRELAETKAKLAKAEADLVRADAFRRFIIARGHAPECIEWMAREHGDTELADILANVPAEQSAREEGK